MALVDLDYFKDFLGVSGTSQDTRLQAYLDGAIASVKAYCKRDLESTTYPNAAGEGQGDSRFYCGNGTRFLILRQRPVTAVSAIYVDSSGNFGDNPDGSFDATATVLTYGTDYVVHWDGCLPGTSTKCSYKGIVERVGVPWPARSMYMRGNITPAIQDGLGNIKVTYTAGYSEAPPDLKTAVCLMGAAMRRNADKGGPVTSESLGSYSYSLGAATVGSGLPEFATIRQLLSRYREVVV